MAAANSTVPEGRVCTLRKEGEIEVKKQSHI